MGKQESRQDNRWITALSTLLALSIALNLIFYDKKVNILPRRKEMAKANVELNKQLQYYKHEITKYTGISERIDKVVEDAAKKMEEKEAQIIALKKENRAAAAKNIMLSTQIDSLQESYLGIIDSLLVEREKNKVINQKIAGFEETVIELNAKIGVGARLLGDNLVITPFKKNPNGKRQASAMAKKTTEFEICLDILENRLSKSGMKNIYFVVISPNAEVVFDNEPGYPKEFYNPELRTTELCSRIEKIDYRNKKVVVCSIVRPKNPLTTGLYIVEAFSDDQKLAMTTFTLR